MVDQDFFPLQSGPPVWSRLPLPAKPADLSYLDYAIIILFADGSEKA